ncbi:MAG: hypothetical protein ACLFSQ_11095 [Candidatus Zixiibacteriota bacterium]
MAEWSEISLYTISEDGNDLADYEPVLAESAASVDHDLVKGRIEDDLLNRLKHLQQRGEDYYGEDFYLLDHIENPETLKRPACYYALYLMFRGKIISEMDEYARRSIEYEKLYSLALDAAARRLRWDIGLIKRRSGRIKLRR